MLYNLIGNVYEKAYDVERNQIYTAYSSKGMQVYDSLDKYHDGRLLLFEDDFDGETINDNNWNYELGIPRDEIQYYRRENVSVKDSCLVITAKKESYMSHSWTSGCVSGQGKNGWRYGRFEAKIKFPGCVGAFPAFWLMGLNSYVKPNESDSFIPKNRMPGAVPWPDCGEIDIIEVIPGDSKQPAATIWSSHSIEPYTSLYSCSGSNIETSEWHVYAAEITPTDISFFIDDSEIGKMSFSDYAEERIAAYKLPLRVILNLAIGHGTPTVDTMNMYVDWVRIYAPIDIQAKINETSIELPETIELNTGNQYFMFPTFTPIDSSNRSVCWYVDNQNVATIDSGVITAVSEGNAKIVVISVNGKIAISEIVVSDNLLETM